MALLLNQDQSSAVTFPLSLLCQSCGHLHLHVNSRFRSLASAVVFRGQSLNFGLRVGRRGFRLRLSRNSEAASVAKIRSVQVQVTLRIRNSAAGEVQMDPWLNEVIKGTIFWPAVLSGDRVTAICSHYLHCLHFGELQFPGFWGSLGNGRH